MHKTNKGLSKETPKRLEQKLKRVIDRRCETVSTEKKGTDKLSRSDDVHSKTLQELRDTIRATKSANTRNVVHISKPKPQSVSKIENSPDATNHNFRADRLKSGTAKPKTLKLNITRPYSAEQSSSLRSDYSKLCNDNHKLKVRSNIPSKEIKSIKHNTNIKPKVEEYANVHLKHTTKPIRNNPNDKSGKLTKTKPTNSHKPGISEKNYKLDVTTTAINKYSTPREDYKVPSSNNLLQKDEIKKITRENKPLMIRSNIVKESPLNMIDIKNLSAIKNIFFNEKMESNKSYINFQSDSLFDKSEMIVAEPKLEMRAEIVLLPSCTQIKEREDCLLQQDVVINNKDIASKPSVKSSEVCIFNTLSEHKKVGRNSSVSSIPLQINVDCLIEQEFDKIKDDDDHKDVDKNFKNSITNFKNEKDPYVLNNIDEVQHNLTDIENISKENNNETQDDNKNIKETNLDAKNKDSAIVIKHYNKENSNDSQDKSQKIEENTKNAKSVCLPKASKFNFLEQKGENCKNCIISFKTQIKKSKISCMTHRVKQCKLGLLTSPKIRKVSESKIFISEKPVKSPCAVGDHYTTQENVNTIDEYKWGNKDSGDIYPSTINIKDETVLNMDSASFKSECNINSLSDSDHLKSSNSSCTETITKFLDFGKFFNCMRPSKPISMIEQSGAINVEETLKECKLSEISHQGLKREGKVAVTDNEYKPLVPVAKDDDLVDFNFEEFELFTKDDEHNIGQEEVHELQDDTASFEYEEDVSELREIMENIRSTCKIADSLSENDLIKEAAELRHALNRLKFAVDLFQQKYNFKIYLLETIKSELKIRARSKIFNIILKSSNFANYFEDSNVDYMFRSLCDIGYNLSNSAVDKYIPETERDEVKYELKISDLRKIGPSSLFVKWSISTIQCVIGYEILVNDVLKSRVFSPLRTASTLDGLGAQITLIIAVYAVTSKGRCEPPAIISHTILQ